MGACCSQHHDTEINYIHTNGEADDAELNYVYTGGEGKQLRYGRYKPVAPLNATSVEIDPSVKEIGNGAFKGHNKIKSITLPDNVQVVGAEAFIGCHKLSMVELPSTLTQIKEHAFSWCESLQMVRIPEVVFENDHFKDKQSLTK
eukprot:3057043-Ditylum_brightwellii.AAC.1